MDAIVILGIALYFYLKAGEPELEIVEATRGREIKLNTNFIRNDNAFTEVYSKLVNTYINR